MPPACRGESTGGRIRTRIIRFWRPALFRLSYTHASCRAQRETAQRETRNRPLRDRAGGAFRVAALDAPPAQILAAQILATFNVVEPARSTDHGYGRPR